MVGRSMRGGRSMTRRSSDERMVEGDEGNGDPEQGA